VQVCKPSCPAGNGDAGSRLVWEFIKPPESSVLTNPDIVRGFTAPGIGSAAEVQVFISVRDGLERVSALEVMEEIPQELAITRSPGVDSAARGRTSLRDGEGGAMVLEHG
jgi:hypothetical protein